MTGVVARAAGLTLDESPIERTAIDTLRALAIDAAQASRSATPDAMAPLVYVLWQRFVRFDPDDPGWPSRDRFLLCADGAPALLAALLHLAGVKANGPQHDRELAVTLGDLERFGERAAQGTPFEPLPGENLLRGRAHERLAASTAVALAARERAERFDRPGFAMFDSDVYVLCGDGCLDDDAASKAALRAAELGLSNLCWIYDDTRPASAAGDPDRRGAEVAERMRACGWNAVRVDDGADTAALSDALESFRSEGDRPTLVVVGGEASAPSSGHERLRVPPGVREHFRDGAGRRGRALRNAWFVRLAAYRELHPELAEEIDHMTHLAIPGIS